MSKEAAQPAVLLRSIVAPLPVMAGRLVATSLDVASVTLLTREWRDQFLNRLLERVRPFAGSDTRYGRDQPASAGFIALAEWFIIRHCPNLKPFPNRFHPQFELTKYNICSKMKAING
jgi:hypothetical protein